MASVGDVGGARPQAQVNQANGANKSGASEGISGSTARKNAEGAYDNLFFATTGGGLGNVGDGEFGAVGGQEARFDEAKSQFNALKEAFLKDPPKGAIKDAFGDLAGAMEKYGTLGFSGSEAELFNKTAEGDAVPLNEAQRQEVGHAIDEALDRFWNKVAENVPDASKLKETAGFAFLNGPKAQQVMKTLAPIIAKLWAPATKVPTESMAGSQSAAGIFKAKEDVATAEKASNASAPTPAESKALSTGLSQLLALGGKDMDIESMIQIVMLECGQDATLELRDQMKTQHARTQEKAQVRSQIAAMKKESSDIEAQLKHDFASDQAAGLVGPTCTFEAYCSARTINWGTYDPTSGKIVPRSEVAPMTGPFPPEVGPSESLKDLMTALGSGTTFQAGSTGKEVEELQMLLCSAGYPCEVTGTVDAATLSAMNAFKASKGKASDGVMGAADVDALLGAAKIMPKELSDFFSSGKVMKTGTAGEEVRQFQAMLKDQGYDVDITGTVDAKTMNAINQINPAGTIDASWVAKMAAENKGYTLTPTQRFQALGGAGPKKEAPAGMTSMTTAQFSLAIDERSQMMETLGDQSQEDQTKMQITLDRYTKAYDALSNIMKKLASAADTIVGNFK